MDALLSDVGNVFMTNGGHRISSHMQEEKVVLRERDWETQKERHTDTEGEAVAESRADGQRQRAREPV